MCPRKPDGEEINLLQELQRLQAREPLPDIEPPALIDQAVRNMARRELPHKRSALAGNLPWIAGLSTASIALIALGISMVQTPPTAPGPGNETFENRTIELRSEGEMPDLASPAAPQVSRSAQAQAAAPAAATRESLHQSAPMAKESAIARPEQDSRKALKTSQESDLADSAYDNRQATAEEVHQDNDSLDTRENSATAWLDLIEQLNDQGLHAEALEQMRAWQEQYPDVPLPDWAIDLLQAQP